MCLNGGPKFKINESLSFVVECESEEDVDKYWNELTADGGSSNFAGRLKQFQDSTLRLSRWNYCTLNFYGHIDWLFV